MRNQIKTSKPVKVEPHYCSFHTKPKRSTVQILKIARFFSSISLSQKNKVRARGVGPQPQKKFIIPTIIVTCSDDDDSDTNNTDTLKNGPAEKSGKIVFTGDEGIFGNKFMAIDKPPSYDETMLNNYNSRVIIRE
ncbi:10214_t:CDS:1 [Ambispora gerdemannii]|uniref:10214_t:CDS:1 n=1 Tax=Ambispora gerdemannii TaxID=144530 RepID=A0A9N9AJ57_9GLOM|nr:10214_t:CDS:1 [Ambispora gerdemannii]